MSRLKDKYLSEVVKGLQEKYNYKNIMQIPKVTKIVINMAVGESRYEFQGVGCGCRRYDDNFRTKADYYKGEKIHRGV